jgi:hypothetical protein
MPLAGDQKLRGQAGAFGLTEPRACWTVKELSRVGALAGKPLFNQDNSAVSRKLLDHLLVDAIIADGLVPHMADRDARGREGGSV